MGGPEASSRTDAPETSAGATAGESVPAPLAPEAAGGESGRSERSADATRPSSSRALLAADVGTVYTKVYLLEEVGGDRRLVAVGRVPSAGADGTLAPRQALAGALAQALQRAGRGADGVPQQRLLMTSAGTVPRLAIVAAGGSDARAIGAAVESLPARILEPLLLDGPARDPEQLLGQLEAQAPDAVIVAGGGRPAERELAAGAVEVIARGFGRHAPLVILVGDAEFAARAAGTLEGGRFLVAGNRPGEDVRDLAGGFVAERLGAAWEAEGDLDGWLGGGGAHSSLEGVCAATSLIADRYDVDVLTLDLGAAHAMAVASLGQSGQRRIVSVTRDDLGLRLGRHTVLREAGADPIAAWLPLDVDAAALRHDARLGTAVPAAVPETVDDLLLEHAFAREALRLLLEDLAARFAAGGTVSGPAALPPVDLVIGSGGALAGVPRLTQAALILLDAVQPDALTQLALDRATALALLGRIGIDGGASALGAALERDGLLNLGLCIAPVGSGKEGEPAIKVEVVYASRSPVTVDVAVGAIEVVPLPIGERASLKLWPARDFDIGLGRGAAATPRAEVEGGAVGIIVDARGRPLTLPASREKRQAKLLQWLQSTGAYPQFSFVHGTTDAGSAGGEGAQPQPDGTPGAGRTPGGQRMSR